MTVDVHEVSLRMLIEPVAGNSGISDPGVNSHPLQRDVVILGGDCPWTWALANAVRQPFGPVPIILEGQQSIARLIRRRIHRLGLVTVFGQIAFGVMAKAIRNRYRAQEQHILAREGLDTRPSTHDVIRVVSANDDITIKILREVKPKVVIVSQTRILARQVLDAIPATFINIHTGITPLYRGLHGAYWALVNGDAVNCGVTVHVVDAGVDTGPIIAQARIQPSPSDSYFTYHWLQLAAALPLLLNAVYDAMVGKLVTQKPPPEFASRQYYHPTLWTYLRSGLQQGVW